MSQLVVIGASWGGLRAIGTVLGALPEAFPAPVLIVQHRAEEAQALLAGLLARGCPLEVREVTDKAPLRGGCVHVAPSGYHVLVEPDHLALSTEEAVRFNRPSIDVALESASEAFGAQLIGVVLTGANDDGARGLAEVRRRGGVGIVQDPKGAERAAMPAAAAAAAHPQLIVALEEIGPLLASLTGVGSSAEGRRAGERSETR